MENRKFIILILFLTISFVFPSKTFSYSTITHQALTKEAIEFHNEFNVRNKVSENSAEYIILGSKEEDSPIYRTLTHFYDPIYNRGLFNKFLPAYDWAENTTAQAMTSIKYVALSKLMSLFSSNTDYSFDRAVYEYVHGDKERGLESLGHILHLVEDMAVPAHTRNDQHIDGDPYETYAKRFTTENIRDVSGELMEEYKFPKKLDSLFDYFYNLASFTNNNFFSRDTVVDGEYNKPIINETGIISLGGQKYLESVDGNGNKFLLVAQDILRNRMTGEVTRNLYIEDENNQISPSYWKILSKQAVLYAAGVLDLFFKRVAEEEDTLALFQKNRNSIKRLFGAGLYQGASVANAPITNEPKEKIPEAQPTIIPTTPTTLIKPEETPKQSPESEVPKTDPSIPDTPPVPTTESTLSPDTVPMVQPTQSIPVTPTDNSNISSPTPIQGAPGFGGGGGGSNQESNEATNQENNNQNDEENNEQATTPDPPIITSPTNESTHATTTITFSGTIQSSDPTLIIISNDFSTPTTTPDQNGDWAITFQNFSQGTTTINFYSSDETATSSPTEISIFIDTQNPSFTDFEINECNFSISMDVNACLIPTTEINLSWTADEENISYYSVLVNDTESTTTTEDSTQIILPENSPSEVKVIAVDRAGNRATSTSQVVQTTTMPIIINEIAWSGTQASSADEWIELYNRSEEEINLSNLKLKAEDGVPFIDLSGTIPPKNFFRIERTDDEPINSPASLIATFSGEGSGSGLGNEGEVLSILFTTGMATTTVDSTPAIVDCGGGWCAGTASTEYRSMERVDPDKAGTLAGNWASNNTYKKNNNDKDGNPLNGTPGSRNSANVSESGIGYFCGPYNHSFQEGQTYSPTGTYCRYIFPSFRSTTSYASVFLGEVGNSTQLTAHKITGHTKSNIEKSENDGFISNLNSGDKVFIAIYKISTLGHCNVDDCSGNILEFKNYFEGTGTTTPANLQWSVLNWVYGE